MLIPEGALLMAHGFVPGSDLISNEPRRSRSESARVTAALATSCATIGL